MRNLKCFPKFRPIAAALTLGLLLPPPAFGLRMQSDTHAGLEEALHPDLAQEVREGEQVLGRLFDRFVGAWEAWEAEQEATAPGQKRDALSSAMEDMAAALVAVRHPARVGDARAMCRQLWAERRPENGFPFLNDDPPSDWDLLVRWTMLSRPFLHYLQDDASRAEATALFQALKARYSAAGAEEPSEGRTVVIVRGDDVNAWLEAVLGRLPEAVAGNIVVMTTDAGLEQRLTSANDNLWVVPDAGAARALIHQKMVPRPDRLVLVTRDPTWDPLHRALQATGMEEGTAVAAIPAATFQTLIQRALGSSAEVSTRAFWNGLEEALDSLAGQA